MNDECLNCVARKFCDYDEPAEDWTCEHREAMEQEYNKINGIEKEQSIMIEIDEYDSPYEVARKIIDAKHIVVKKFVNGEKECEEPVFDTSELLKIGKHLMSYAQIERENSYVMGTNVIEL